MDKAEKTLRLLFIGNSHTFFNDMPLMVQRRAREAGFDCSAVMIAHGGWYLAQHAEEPDVRFNILYGGYDYIVLQEHAHPFGPEEKYFSGIAKLGEFIRKTDSVPVIYETWAQKKEPGIQSHMNEVHRQAAEKIGALVAPVGEKWWEYKNSRPDLELYWSDGAHASPAGSDFAAEQIWQTIRDDLARKGS